MKSVIILDLFSIDRDRRSAFDINIFIIFKNITILTTKVKIAISLSTFLANSLIIGGKKSLSAHSIISNDFTSVTTFVMKHRVTFNTYQRLRGNANVIEITS